MPSCSIRHTYPFHRRPASEIIRLPFATTSLAMSVRDPPRNAYVFKNQATFDTTLGGFRPLGGGCR